MRSFTRRDLIAGLAYSSLSLSSGAALPTRSAAGQSSSYRDTTFLEIIRQPDSVTVFVGLGKPQSLNRAGARWETSEIRVRIEPGQHELPLSISAPGSCPTHIHVRWNIAVAANLLVLGDHWERSYGDLRWSCLVPERVMPWYFLTSKESLHGYGVKTGSGALCFWQLDPDGVSLWLNICNGGSGVELGERELLAATVVSRRGEPGEDPVSAAKAFCTRLCDRPRSAPSVIYGSNDWYYAYGENSATQIVRDAELMSSVAPQKGERPFTVIDDGWKNKEKYPDMAALAQAIRQQGALPGLWIRPLEAPGHAPSTLLLPKERFGPHAARRSGDLAYDPTVPDALEAVLGKVKEATGWGYELVKHDYTTFDLLGQWGFEMKAAPTLPDWNFHDRSKTNAEILRGLYVSIRNAAGDGTILIGCNTIGHLAAGLFQVQRTGDDTSGRNWERTRRMGVNTLAYRLAQNRTFFLIDADCVPITTATPWSCIKQWLDLVARSGTVLFVSPEPVAIGAEQRQALREAFQIAVSAEDHARPIDWQTTTTPSQWEFGGCHGQIQRKYDWYQQSGAWPYDV